MAGSGRGLAPALVLVVLLVVALAGCAGRAVSGPRSLSAESTPQTRPAAAPLLTPGPITSPERPSASLRAATDVVRHYYALIDHLRTNMDAAGVAALMTSDCRCRAVPRDIARRARAGERYYGTAHRLSLLPSRDDAINAEVLVQYDATRYGLIGANGKVIEHDPPRHGIVENFRLVHSHGRWLIWEIGQIERGTR